MPCGQERSLFLRRPAPGSLARGGNSSVRLPRTIHFFNQIEVEWQNWNQMSAAGKLVARRCPSLTAPRVCVFFSVGPRGADAQPHRGGLPGGRRHHPVSAHFQRHQPGAAPRHHTDVCGESDQVSLQGGEETLLSCFFAAFGAPVSQRQFIYLFIYF